MPAPAKASAASLRFFSAAFRSWKLSLLPGSNVSIMMSLLREARGRLERATRTLAAFGLGLATICAP